MQEFDQQHIHLNESDQQHLHLNDSDQQHLHLNESDQQGYSSTDSGLDQALKLMFCLLLNVLLIYWPLFTF